MVEGENIVQYCGRINEVLNSRKGANENSDEENTIKKGIENSSSYLCY